MMNKPHITADTKQSTALPGQPIAGQPIPGEKIMLLDGIPPLGAIRILGWGVTLTAKESDENAAIDELPGLDETDNPGKQNYVRFTTIDGDAHIALITPDDLAQNIFAGHDDFPLMEGQSVVLAIDEATHFSIIPTISTRRATVTAIPIESA